MPLALCHFAVLASTEFLIDHAQWLVAGVIAVIGLLIVGFADLRRFSFTRAWAISGVSFAESIRRRVLWITPLAILGVIVVAQMQKAVDAQDAMRQTAKFCLFATGLVVTIAAIILSCTSLPKEIENRVIYTVVTKPTTRLELIVGKVMGFARVSGAILLIMGLFSLAYLHVRAWNMRRTLAEDLDAGRVEPVLRPTLEHYREAGLLNAKVYEGAPLAMYASEPQGPGDIRWILGDGQQFLYVPFEVTAKDLTPPGLTVADAGKTGLDILVRVQYRQRALTTREAAEIQTQQVESGVVTPEGPTTSASPVPPGIAIDIASEDFYTIVGWESLGRKAMALPEKSGEAAIVHFPPEVIHPLASRMPADRPMRLFVVIRGVTPGMQLGVATVRASDVANLPAAMIVPGAEMGIPRPIAPLSFPPHDVVPVLCRGRPGTFGQQLRGGTGEGVAVYHFRNAVVRETAPGKASFELRIGLERSGAEAEEADLEEPTRLAVQVHRPGDRAHSDEIIVKPESNRTAFFQLPVAALGDGNFDMTVRALTPGIWIGLRGDSVKMVAANHSFSLNLFKSLLILWMMSVLVVIVSVFCSTFLSWPIAVVLTLLLLLGRWGVDQLQREDALGADQARAFVNDMGLKDPSAAKMLSSTFSAMTSALKAVSTILPDIGKFSAMEDIDAGVWIPARRILDGLEVLAVFGVSMTVLAYIFLKYKEVAP